MMRALVAFAIAVNGLFLGCSGSEQSSEVMTVDVAPATEAPQAVLGEDFREIIRSRAYLAWQKESKVHPSTGPHGGNVRTYVNDSLFASLSAGSTEHPKGSIAVKELYGSGTSEVTGYAVMQKNDDGWYWYEDFGGGAIEGQNRALCVNCHSGSTRGLVLAPFPLQ